MHLVSITKEQFPLWREMREGVYNSLSHEFHDQEMKQILASDDWFSYFLINDKNQQIGFVELSLRNIVDGCLTSPVAYLEGIYLKKEYRRQGLGREAIEVIKNWCEKKGVTELGLDTELDNASAQKFFKAMGLKETYRIVQYRIELSRI